MLASADDGFPPDFHGGQPIPQAYTIDRHRNAAILWYLRLNVHGILSAVFVNHVMIVRCFFTVIAAVSRCYFPELLRQNISLSAT